MYISEKKSTFNFFFFFYPQPTVPKIWLVSWFTMLLSVR